MGCRNCTRSERISGVEGIRSLEGHFSKSARSGAPGRKSIVIKKVSDLARIDRMKDADIDYSDIPRLGKAFFRKATMAWPPEKKQLTIRLDADVLEWLKGHGKGYQTRVNRISARGDGESAAAVGALVGSAVRRPLLEKREKWRTRPYPVREAQPEDQPQEQPQDQSPDQPQEQRRRPVAESATRTGRPPTLRPSHRPEAGRGRYGSRMESMKFHTEYLTLHTKTKRAHVRLTPMVQIVLMKSGIKDGMILVSAMHITAGVYVNDDESAQIKDIYQLLETLAPSRENDEHHQTGEDNGDAHLKSLIIHHEVIVPVTNGKLDFGPWQQIFYAEFDGQRDKRVIIKVMGE